MTPSAGLRYFYCPPRNIEKNTLTLDPEESRHLHSVLRKESGDTIHVTDGCGGLYHCTVASVSKNGTRCEVKEKEIDDPPFPVILGQAMIRKERFEWLIEKCTEFGIASIVPIETKRVERRFQPRPERWSKIAVSAMKQSLQTRCPIIRGPCRIADFVHENKAGTLALLAHQGASPTVTSVIPEPGKISEVRILVGPEGGLTPGEVNEAEALGYKPFQMGPSRLRSETAGMLAAGLVMQRLAELRRPSG